jgi:coenzyme F420-dependent glucose-6-phosphate dehydrogenase
LPRHFEQLTEEARDKDIEDIGGVVCGSDPDKHLNAIRQFIDAGFDHVYVHQVGPEQDDFIRFYREEILPEFASESDHQQDSSEHEFGSARNGS